MPLFSIIIPVYKTERYLKECLESVLQQEVNEIEIICVDDGSPDGSATILEEYQKKDSRIKIVTQENQGLSVARNTGIKHATGEYILFLDSDDLYQSNALSIIKEEVEKQDLEMLCCDAECFYENDRLRHMEYKDPYYRRPREYGGPKSGRVIFSEMMEEHAFCDAAWILCIKHEWLLKQNIWFYPGILHEDCLFSFQCFNLAQKVKHIKKELVKYRVRENSIMTSGLGFSSLYGRLICYREVMNVSHSIGKDEVRYQKAVAAYLRFIRENAKYVDYLLSEEENEKYKTLKPLEMEIVESMELGMVGLPEENDIMYMEGFLTHLRKQKNIVLYGAGQIGTRVGAFLMHENMKEKIMGYAVSNMQGAVSTIMDIPVECIDSYKGKDVFVVVTARHNFQRDMTKKLRELGLKKMAVVDLRLEKTIQKYMEEVTFIKE